MHRWEASVKSNKPSRGRIATPAAWRHFGLTSPDRLASPDLFDNTATP
jgi:hypothetical protein